MERLRQKVAAVGCASELNRAMNQIERLLLNERMAGLAEEMTDNWLLRRTGEDIHQMPEFFVRFRRA